MPLGNEEKTPTECDNVLNLATPISAEILRELDSPEGADKEITLLTILTTTESGKSFRTRNPKTQLLITLVRKFAARENPVLIIGETGTGKELIARAIHEHGPRKAGPFRVVNFGAHQDLNFLKSELFGHVKGAYTDAKTSRKGEIEEAAGGTLFLDEIGNIHPDLYGLLLRFLEEGTYTQMGSNVESRANVRIVAATNKPLEEIVKKGTFPADLFYRLSGLDIELVPLRERPEDIEYLARRVLDDMTKADKRNNIRISKGALDALLRYPWPGNVRELRSRIGRAYAVLDADATTLNLDSLPDVVKDPSRWIRLSPGTDTLSTVVALGHQIPAPLDLSYPNQAYSQALARFLKVFLLAVLDLHQWNVAMVARNLGEERMALEQILRTLDLKVTVHGLADGEAYREWKDLAQLNPQLISTNFTLEEAVMKFRQALIQRSIMANGFNLGQTAKALQLEPLMLMKLSTPQGTRDFHDRSFLQDIKTKSKGH
ncbi:MAG: sigma 54-interacting transcriptional regulator [Pseudomonadota bacterium]